jgi:hypothetical protein
VFLEEERKCKDKALFKSKRQEMEIKGQLNLIQSKITENQ